MLYAFVGRFADARAAIARSQAGTHRVRGQAQLGGVRNDRPGWIEMMAGNPAAAEQVLTEGREVLREIGERGWLCAVVTVLARAVYAQGRLDEAQQLTREAEAITAAGDISEQVRWRLTRAKVLARRGRFRAARQLTGEAQARAAPTSWPAMHAGTHSSGRGVRACRRARGSRRQPAHSTAPLRGTAGIGPRRPDQGDTG